MTMGYIFDYSDVPQNCFISGEDLRLNSIIIDTNEITLRLGEIEIKLDNDKLERELKSADTITINGITFRKERNE